MTKNNFISMWKWLKSDVGLIAGLALFKIMLHLPFLARYGYHHDELYFIACGQHLDWGYVDHAPLIGWLAWLANALFGQSLFGLRILATLSGGATIFITGLLTKRLGGGRFAQVVACAAMMIAPVYMRTGNLFCIPAFEPFFWVLAYYILARIIQEDNPKLWFWMGGVVGFGLMNKHSMLFFVFGLLVALAVTPLRKHFKTPYLYLGGGVALLFFLPNILWQIANGWPTLKFLINLNSGVMSGISFIQFLAGQLLYLHIFAAVVWISGLIFLVFKRQGRMYRPLGLIWLAVFILLVFTKSKIYYLAPAYPVLLAAGGLVFERRAKKRNWQRLKPAVISGLVIGGIIMAPLSVPMFNINTTEKYIHGITFGAFKNIYELTKDLRGMFGWPERVEAVAKVYNGLSEAEKKHTIIWAAGYGNAGAVNLFGKKHGLPDAVSLSMTFWLWGLPDHPIRTVIGMGLSEKTMVKLFEEVDLAASIQLKNVNPWVNPFHITVCRKAKKSLAAIWQRNRPWK